MQTVKIQWTRYETAGVYSAYAQGDYNSKASRTWKGLADAYAECASYEEAKSQARLMLEQVGAEITNTVTGEYDY